MPKWYGETYISGDRFGQQLSIAVSSVLLLSITCTVGGVVAWYFSTLGPQLHFSLAAGTFSLKNTRGRLQLTVTSGQGQISAELGLHLPAAQGKSSRKACSSSDVCLRWDNSEVTIVDREHTGMRCVDVLWEALKETEEELKDCFNMSGHWYGAAQTRRQLWPLERWSRTQEPYVAGDSYGEQLGGVIERYFLSSTGTAIFVDSSVPLWTSFNASGDQKLCLIAKYRDSPYRYDFKPPKLTLNYSICSSLNVTSIHQAMVKNYLGHPSETPHESVLTKPIWSTWAQFKKDVNQSLVMQFADDIIRYNFSYSQLEIDDMWSKHYGDFEFDQSKFPSVQALSDFLHKKDFRVTLWTHPFVNVGSLEYVKMRDTEVFVKEPRQMWGRPSLVHWWDGEAALLDVSSPAARRWYLAGLRRLQTTAGIDSFKFDAGEYVWLPRCFTSHENFSNPDEYARLWAEVAFQADTNLRIQEVRVGARTQRLPLLVRMMDKDSRWDNENGLRTLIPAALTFGLLGYPFVLPDMIGGNAYNGSLTGKVYPEPELFVRWAQVAALMPAMQFSVVPWLYSNEVIRLSREAVQLRETYKDQLLAAARQATLTGDPIVRPLWWIAPNDKQAQVIDDQYLLGDTLLIAPVQEKSATSRNIYLPEGRWRDEVSGATINGSTWLKNYPAPLHVLPRFRRLA